MCLAPASLSRHSLPGLEQVAKPLQVERPAAFVTDAVALRLPARAVSIKVPVFKLNPRAFAALRDEADLDLAGSFEIRLDLPLRADVPADPDSVRRLVDEDARPTTLTSIHPPVIDLTAR